MTAVEAIASARSGDASAVPTASVLDDPLEQQRFTRWTVRADGRRVGESTLRVSGMDCAACAGIIETALRAVDGVVEAHVSAAGERAAIVWDPQRTRPSVLVGALRRAGYDAVPDVAASARELRRHENRLALWRLFVASFCAMQVMMLAAPSYFARAGELEPDLRQLLNWGSWLLALPVLVFSSGPFFVGAWRGLRVGRIGMDVPVALGIVVIFVASTGASFDPGGLFGSEVYFDSMTMFVSFLLAARFLELRARHRATATLEQTLGTMPQTVLRLLDDGSTEQVSILRLQPGDRLRVRHGEAFPADGVVVDGRGMADEAMLTGESAPVVKSVGDEVVGGSVNVGGPLTMRVERCAGDTRYEKIVELMRSAFSQRPALMQAADRLAGPFLWVVLLLAAAAAAAWSVIDPARALWVAVSVLIVTCPCALSLAAPSVLVAAAGGLARKGVLLRRLDSLQALAQADRLFIDKTGTLTTDRPALTATRLLKPVSGVASEADALRLAASLGGWSTHPLSAALAEAGSAASAERSSWQEVQERAGLGLQGRAPDGRPWRLGSAAWVGAAPQAGDGDDAGGEVWLGVDGEAVARFEFDETLRPGAVESMSALQQDGVRVTLLSGDRPARVQRLARRLSIDTAVGGASPHDKLRCVEAAQSRGEIVIAVGDGVNDAPLLARADVAVAMGHGALIARSQSDAVLVGDDPMGLVAARRSARRTMGIVRQNLAWAVFYNVACIPLALAGYLPPWAAGLGMAASSLVVVANSLRALR